MRTRALIGAVLAALGTSALVWASGGISAGGVPIAGTDIDVTGSTVSVEPVLDSVTTINGLTTVRQSDGAFHLITVDGLVNEEAFVVRGCVAPGPCVGGDNLMAISDGSGGSTINVEALTIGGTNGVSLTVGGTNAVTADFRGPLRNTGAFNGGAVQVDDTLTLPDARLLDLSAILHNDAAAQGFKLPQANSAPTAITANPGGHEFYDTGFETTWTSTSNGWLPGGDMAGRLSRRRVQWWQVTSVASAILIAVGGPSATVTGTAASAAGSTRMFTSVPTTGVDDNVSGWSVNNTTRHEYQPRVWNIIQTESSIATRKIEFYLSDIGSTLTQCNATQAIGDDLASICYDTDSTLSTTTWLYCTGDGTTRTCSDSLITVLASTTYFLTIDWSVAGTVVFGINGTYFTKSTNVSATTGLTLVMNSFIKAQAAVIVTHYMNIFGIESN